MARLWILGTTLLVAQSAAAAAAAAAALSLGTAFHTTTTTGTLARRISTATTAGTSSRWVCCFMTTSRRSRKRNEAGGSLSTVSSLSLSAFSLSSALLLSSSSCSSRILQSRLTMVRNIDLPEALILYGRAVLVVGDSHETGIPNPRPGLAQLVQECHDIQTAVVVLLENEEEEDVPPHNNTSSLDDNTDAADRQWLASVLSPSVAKLCHMARQQLQPATTTTTHHSDNSSSSSSRRTPPPPNPAMLLDHVLERITVQPRPYGSASGYFGVVRNTLLSDDDSFRHRRLVEAKHCVVLATTLEQTRSARAVGMRVVSLLNDNTDNNNDTLADAVLSIDALEDYGVDDFATPGTFWLNPPQARDDFGNTVDPYQLKQDYNYYNSYNSYGGTDDDMSGTDAQNTITVAAAAAAVLDSNKDDDFGIDMKAILADLAPLKPKSMD